ncbi:MAG: hypothetical protein JSV03_00245 [Planctomycetota bacterium]|nr:MAG: hypothetical protein JSV03_00245 [Planctomycetota bacterium]
MVKIQFSDDEGSFKFPPWVIYVAIGLVVVVGVYIVHATWTEGDKPLSSPWVCLTEDCGQVESIVPKLGDPAPPLICSKCGNKSLVPAYNCPHCGSLVVMNYWRGITGTTRCAKCDQEVNYGD